MRVAHERRRPRTPDALRVEDLISPEILDNEMVDREYLRQVFREPRKYLPPPRGRERAVTETVREPESRGAKLAKLTGLTMAGALLVGAVAASSMLSRGRDGAAASNSPAPPQITGAAALGGFASGGAPEEHGSSTVGHSGASASPTTQAPAARNEPLPAVATTAPEGTSTTTTTAPEVTDAERLAVVSEFYRRVDTAPERALDLLSPALAGEEAGDLVRAWSTMRDVEVLETQVESDGSVLAVVLMHRDDGNKLRVTQQLGFDESGQSISRAVLLGAEEL